MLKSESLTQISESEPESEDETVEQIVPDKEEPKLKIDEQKEEIVQTNETEIKAEKENEIETVVTEEAESLAVATISSDLAPLKDSKEKLEKLKDSAKEKGKKSKADLAKVLTGIKALSKNLNLDEIRKQGKLSETGIENKTEVFLNLFQNLEKGQR